MHFGGNWTCVNLKDTLAGVTWEQATRKVYSFNTIATLVYHINYYVIAQIRVLEGGPLDAKDEYSFDVPPITSQAEWEAMLEQVWANAEQFAALLEQMPDDKLGEFFVEEKYGIYYRHMLGPIEHTHYHLGQITLIKKIVQSAEVVAGRDEMANV